MQALNGRLVLSPSDLNDYVECPHLTTLALEVARGARPRPFVLNEHGDLLRREYTKARRGTGIRVKIGSCDYSNQAAILFEYNRASTH